MGGNTDELGPSFQRERAAILAADTEGELTRIRLDGAAERAPLIIEASKWPPKRRSVKPTPLRLAEVHQRKQRQHKPELRKSPLEIGPGSVEGQRKQTRPGIVVTRGP